MPRIAHHETNQPPRLGVVALALSLGLHAGLLMWVEVRGHARPAPVRALVDSWLGPGIEVDAVGPAPMAPVAAPVPATQSAPPGEAAAEHSLRAHASRKTSVNPSPTATAPSAPQAPGQGAPSSAAAEVTSVGNAPAFGAAGLPTGVRHLPKAFTRAIGIASRGDTRWLTLPPGPVGQAQIELTVDEEGRLGELSYPDPKQRDALAPVVRHLLENTALLLASGRFSLDPSKVAAGVQRLRVRVEISERPPSDDAEGDPNGLKELEYEPPSGGKPGRGSFALNSGRRVIGWVYVE